MSKWKRPCRSARHPSRRANSIAPPPPWPALAGRLTWHRKRMRTPSMSLLGAYHTTNWDGILSALGLMASNIRASIIIKNEWVTNPMVGPLVRAFGGVGVDRTSPHDTVTQIAAEFAQREQLVVAITPEGTRRRRERWKTGFYHIAEAAAVPLLLGYLDYPSKTFGISATVVWPTGDIAEDMQAFVPDLARIRPKFPDQAGPMRFQ